MTIKPGTLLKASIILLIVFASCKETETIKRDIIVTPDSSDFIIPIIDNTNSDQIAGYFDASVDIEKEMREITGEFGTNNIRDLRISALKLELPGDTIYEDSNLGNFENIQVEISSGGKSATLAKVNNNPSTKSASLMLGGGVYTSDLSSILTNSSFKYKILVKMRKATKKALSARVTASYTISVGF